MAERSFLATAAFGLEGIAAGELRRLGMRDVRAENGGARFSGTLEDAFRANLWLRTADRVLLTVGVFSAVTFDELFDQIFALPWQEFLPPDAAFPVAAHCARSRLMSAPDTQAIVKKAAAQKLLAAWKVKTLPETGAEHAIWVSIHEDRVHIALNTSGSALSRRGYRTWNGEAPLRETLAAAIVLLSPWRAGQPFLDPMCGAGTLPIEAAMLAADRAPGLLRPFAMRRWPAADGPACDRILEEAGQRVRKGPLDIAGSDIDPAALELCARHLRQAGLEGRVRFERLDARALAPGQAGGAVAVNPPYGERIGDRRQAEECIRVLSALQTRFPSWSLTAISPHPAFERLYGRRASSRRRVYNGRLECGVYTFPGR